MDGIVPFTFVCLNYMFLVPDFNSFACKSNISLSFYVSMFRQVYPIYESYSISPYALLSAFCAELSLLEDFPPILAVPFPVVPGAMPSPALDALPASVVERFS